MDFDRVRTIPHHISESVCQQCLSFEKFLSFVWTMVLYVFCILSIGTPNWYPQLIRRRSMREWMIEWLKWWFDKALIVSTPIISRITCIWYDMMILAVQVFVTCFWVKCAFHDSSLFYSKLKTIYGFSYPYPSLSIYSKFKFIMPYHVIST